MHRARLAVGTSVAERRVGPSLNAGEVEKPMNADYRIILQYNGYWGSTNSDDLGIRVLKSPPGPASHCEWKHPDRPSIAHCEY